MKVDMDPKESRLEGVRRRLFEPVDAASLGAFRMMFAAVMLWEVWRYFDHGWIGRYFIEPALHFKFYGFEWVRAWPGDGMYWHFAALGVLALLITLGLFYRAAMALFFLGFSYVFLLDQGRYLNHFYLICLFSFLLTWTGADRWASLDRRLFFRDAPETVPRWQVLMLRAQVFIVYFYAGLAKLNPDWLRGEPVRSWLAERAPELPFGSLLTQEWAVWVVAYGGLVFDLAIGFLLVARPTRPVGILLAALFHVTNNFLFHIGIFPYLGLAMTLLFLDPDWPRRLLKRAPTVETAGVPPSPVARRLVPAFLCLYFAFQILMPLRHWLYPGDVAWTEEGHRFSWRMKLRDKDSRISIIVRDPASGQEWPVDPNEHLPPWQLDEAMGRPDMLVQFAHYLRDLYRDRGVARPEVYVSVLCSLNGRPERELVDPEVDLAAVKRSLGHQRWILPRGE